FFRDLHISQARDGKDDRVMSRTEPRSSGRGGSMSGKSNRIVLAALAATALALCILPATAGASVGQISSFGSVGNGTGQFREPALFGVDPVDGSIYTGDVTENRQNYRIEKFTSSGTFVASTTIHRFSDFEEKEPKKTISLEGFAIDHAENKFYALE